MSYRMIEIWMKHPLSMQSFIIRFHRHPGAEGSVGQGRARLRRGSPPQFDPAAMDSRLKVLQLLSNQSERPQEEDD
jgi:hypothetical protein